MSTDKNKQPSATAKLDTLGGTHAFPIMEGTVGRRVIDISKLYAQTGQVTYDPGFTSTASCESQITNIDGGDGVLW